MMKNSLWTMGRALALTGVLGAMGVAAVACAAEPCPEAAVPGLAIAVGTRSNSPTPVMPDQLQPELDKIIAATEGGDTEIGVTFVRVDGEPTIACATKFDAGAKNAIARDANRAGFANDIANAAVLVRAEHDEVDVLGALGLASASAGPDGTVVLIDSGLQTKAPLSFVEPGMLDADADAVVAELVKADALPDLRDRRVILAGIGYTAPPQKPLDEARRRHLVELWTKIVTKANATNVVVASKPNTTDSPTGLPKVSEIPVPDPDQIQVGCNTKSVFTNDSSVGFLPDSTVFKDRARAEGVLAEYADWLRETAHSSAVVTGSIAHYGTDEGDSGLSRARAGKVRDVLVRMGARRDQVSAHGEGWGPEPTKDAPPSAAADQLNRRVVIVLGCG